MDNNLNKIFEQWDNFKESHLKLYTPERKRILVDLYNRLRCECRDDAKFALDDRQTSLVIHITASSFITSDDAPTLRELIHNANVFQAETVDGKIVFHLGYRCWDWLEKP